LFRSPAVHLAECGGVGAEVGRELVDVVGVVLGGVGDRGLGLALVGLVGQAAVQVLLERDLAVLVRVVAAEGIPALLAGAELAAGELLVAVAVESGELEAIALLPGLLGDVGGLLGHFGHGARRGAGADGTGFDRGHGLILSTSTSHLGIGSLRSDAFPIRPACHTGVTTGVNDVKMRLTLAGVLRPPR
jgi:hypothetical protein